MVRRRTGSMASGGHARISQRDSQHKDRLTSNRSDGADCIFRQALTPGSVEARECDSSLPRPLASHVYWSPVPPSRPVKIGFLQHGFAAATSCGSQGFAHAPLSLGKWDYQLQCRVAARSAAGVRQPSWGLQMGPTIQRPKGPVRPWRRQQIPTRGNRLAGLDRGNGSYRGVRELRSKRPLFA